MSVRQYSLYDPVPWIDGGVLSLLRVLAQLKTKVSFVVVPPHVVTLWSWTEGASLRGGPIAFWTFCMIPISYGIPSPSP